MTVDFKITSFLFSMLFHFQVTNKLLYPRVPNLRDLMPADLRWSCCDNNGNTGYNKCNLESFHPIHRKTVFHETSSWCQKGWEPLNQYKF